MTTPNRIHIPTFDPVQHRYGDANNPSARFTSVTSILKQYEQPYTVEDALRLGARDEAEALIKLSEWKEKGETAKGFGSKVDALFQEIYETEKTTTENIFTRVAYHARFREEVLSIKEELPPITMQWVMLDPETNIAGTLDVTYNYSGVWFIADVKTGKEPTQFNRLGKKLLYPFEQYDQCSYYCYAIQLSLYAHLLEVNGNTVNRNSLFIFHVGKSGTIRKYLLPYIPEIEIILAERRVSF